MRRSKKVKTFKDIKDSFKKKVNAKKPVKRKYKDRGDVYSFKDVQAARNELREDLIAYYSTPEGRAEIDDSPHRDLLTAEAVDLLMQDIDVIIKREINYE